MSQKRRGFTLIELMIVVVIVGILAAIAIPNFISMQDRATEAKVLGAMHTVQLAAEDFAVRHDGIYSDAAADLLPLLPGGQMLDNAYTGKPSEPRFGEVATQAGEVGIVAIRRNGVAIGYTITGFGRRHDSLMTLNSQD